MKRIGKISLIRILAFIAAVFVSVSFSSVRSYAVSRADIDTSRSGSLTVTHTSVDNELMAGVASHLYLVATIDENGQYTITDDFKAYFDDQDFFNNDYDYDDWKSCVAYEETGDTDNLKTYVKSKGIKAVAEGTSNSKGETYYTNLTLGVYYVLSDRLEKDGYTHSFVNFVYPVPILELDKSTGKISVNYNAAASPKKSKVKNTVISHCRIIKRWDDDGYTNRRPSSVTFNIYCDGYFRESVRLSSANNWYYEWQQEGVHDYTVEESSAGAGYTSSVAVIKRGNDFEFICTNSYNPPPPPTENPPEEPGTPDEPGQPAVPGIPSIPEVLGAIRELPQVLGARRLPQTGQLWWPLPILVIAGIFFIIKGIRKNNRSNHE